ncbi:hypothetical protein FKV24_006705, partial [Lysobacter maris]
MSGPCRLCGCKDASGAKQHAMLDALAADDVDRAIDLGLMAAEPCPCCKPTCHLPLVQARAALKHAHDARDRYRERMARLQRLADEREAARATTQEATAVNPDGGDHLR